MSRMEDLLEQLVEEVQGLRGDIKDLGDRLCGTEEKSLSDVIYELKGPLGKDMGDLVEAVEGMESTLDLSILGLDTSLSSIHTQLIISS